MLLGSPSITDHKQTSSMKNLETPSVNSIYTSPAGHKAVSSPKGTN